MRTIHNPILPGFHADPSICRVGDDYYIATSTFEWFPGVQIHHSRDLVHWRLLTRPLNRLSQLDLHGCPHSAGVWAPCLSHDGERFYLIYPNTRHWGEGWWDSPNYLVMTEYIEGPWSEPVFLNASGFDPSLFHDADGRKWLTNMRWDGRPGQKSFSGIELQEYDPARQELTGPVSLMWQGTKRGITEGSHIYQRDGWYWLLCAEGGTGHGHCVSIARSRCIEGPYEAHPDNPILHAPRDADPVLYKCGHASLVQAGDGTWWLPHLCGRPFSSVDESDQVEGNRYCPLGRESAMQQIDWPAGEWPRLSGGGSLPRLQWEAPELPPQPWPEEPERIDFNITALPLCFQSLREPISDDWCSLSARIGWLRLRGRCGLDGTFNQSLLARRVDRLAFTVSTRLDFLPQDFKQRAGLVLYYDRKAYRFLSVTANDEGRRVLVLEGLDTQAKPRHWRDAEQVQLPAAGPVELRFSSDAAGRVQCSWRVGSNDDWVAIGAEQNLMHISDEHPSDGQFTGAFVGMAACDQRYYRQVADFEYFQYGDGCDRSMM